MWDWKSEMMAWTASTREGGKKGEYDNGRTLSKLFIWKKKRIDDAREKKKRRGIERNDEEEDDDDADGDVDVS